MGIGLSVMAEPLLQLLYPDIPQTAAAAADWVANWLAQEADNRKARRTQLQAQMFLCKLVGDEKAVFLDAQKPLLAALAAAGVRSRNVAATSGAARRSLGPAVRKP